MNRAGMAALTVVLVAVPLIGASCGGDGDAGATLPPIITTTSSSISLVTTTFIVTYYEVKRGDNLGNIAKMHGVDIAELMALNNIPNANEIEAGQSLLIPPPTTAAAGVPTS